jgi:hypothetical protein
MSNGPGELIKSQVVDRLMLKSLMIRFFISKYYVITDYSSSKDTDLSRKSREEKKPATSSLQSCRHKHNEQLDWTRFQSDMTPIRL